MFKVNKIVLFFVFALLLIFITEKVQAVRYISNSEDWRDVYSVLLFANLNGGQANFLTSAKHSSLILYSIKKTEEITIISSSANRFVIGYKDTLENEGYTNVEELVYNNVNLELAKKLTNINKFIIVGDSYGYNALSAASYAVVDKYYVLFANTRNIRDIDNFLSENNPTSLILFGQLEREVKARLAKYNPEIVNKDGRFENNIEMVKKYMKVKPIKQVVISNGEFIEQSLMDGVNPVLYVGRANVPDEINQYIKEAGFEVAVLIGNELINSAQMVKNKIGISVFVKFAQGARVPTGSISQVEDLDKFPMPIYSLNLSVDTISYNKASKSLEITFKNKVALGTYVKSTITINNGVNKLIVGDTTPLFIDANDYRTFIYTETSNGESLVVDGNEATANIYTIYGESKKSLDNILQLTLPINLVDIIDNSEIEITDLLYDKSNNEFLISVENTGNNDVYIDLELPNIIINDEYTTLGTDKVTLIETKNKIIIPIKAFLNPTDIENNPQVTVKAYYGAREQALFKTKQATFEMKTRADKWIYYIVVIVVVIIIIFLFLFLKRKKKKKEYHQQHAHKGN
ncbi:MAG: hypothetical protein QXG00_05250 [Candidatus Woesearchaeota archaeon]